MSNIVNVAWMYPDILNLHGERGNAKAFELVSKKMGVKLNIDRIDDIDSNINYENYDILLFNAGELKHIEKVKERLENDIDKIKEYIKNNKIIFVTGTTGALFAHNIDRLDGSSFNGLNLLDMDVKERSMVLGDDLYYKFEKMEITNFDSHTRAFVKIQDGCNAFCSYCIIPYVRGRVRSKDPEDVIKEVTTLVEKGYKEIVLTGIHTGRYGTDINTTLEELLNKLVNIPNIYRIRLSSIEINEITPGIKELLKENKLNDNKPIVLFFGGSQGAKSINDSLLEIISKKQNQNYQILWAAGPAQYEKIKNELKEKYSIEIDNIEDVSIVPYIYNMEEIMNIVDLVVSRSGAMTITEIANVGVPAIFIPFPFATENHQEYNAKVLENVGAAKIILDKNLTSNELNSTITNLVENKNTLKDMGKKANQVAIQNVEEKIYKEIKEL